MKRSVCILTLANELRSHIITGYGIIVCLLAVFIKRPTTRGHCIHDVDLPLAPIQSIFWILIVTDKHNPNGLWGIPLTAEIPSPPNITDTSEHNTIIKTKIQATESLTLPINQANGVLRLKKQDLANYFSGSLFTPALPLSFELFGWITYCLSRASLQTW